MKKALLDLLICPACLPDEIKLQETIKEAPGEDILEGELFCPECGRGYPIEDGIADLEPTPYSSETLFENKYETMPVVSSYLWSHYADILNDENASEAYQKWAELMQSHDGLAIDAGGAVGRFTFEMAQKSDFAIGLDTSRAFIRTARELMKHREITIALKQEGNITSDVQLSLPREWGTDNLEFIVADALALPFRSDSAGSLSSLNLIDKVSKPIHHLMEMNRVVRNTGAQFLLSDPFSWSEEAAKEEEWLGGKTSGLYAGKGLDNIMALLNSERNQLPPTWDISAHGHAWWKIRTHTNHYEQIRSCYLKASR
jgi:uncharacterized protein YbaR (Trm112 family)/ubiquinone/menaquinone biosynthesis C-methylase UbiE